MKKLTLWRGSLRLISLGLLTLLSGSRAANPRQQAKTEVPRNIELTNAAWAEYDNKNYEAAITAGIRCAERFKKEADGDQARMEKNHVEQPPTGKVTKMTAEQKKAILEQGVLNDVATCYWIAGN